MKKNNLIQEKSFNFSLLIIKLFKKLNNKNEYIISKQLLRSGTSIGANIMESEASISKKDFIYKLTIASKEARETKYWLELLNKSKIVDIEINVEIEEIKSIINILSAIIKTSQNNISQ